MEEKRKRRAISRAGKGTPTWSKKPPAESEECVGSAKEMEMVGAITVCSRGFDVIPSNLVAPKVSNHVLFPHERERKTQGLPCHNSIRTFFSLTPGVGGEDYEHTHKCIYIYVYCV